MQYCMMFLILYMIILPYMFIIRIHRLLISMVVPAFSVALYAVSLHGILVFNVGIISLVGGGGTFN